MELALFDLVNPCIELGMIILGAKINVNIKLLCS